MSQVSVNVLRLTSRHPSAPQGQLLMIRLLIGVSSLPKKGFVASSPARPRRFRPAPLICWGLIAGVLTASAASTYGTRWLLRPCLRLWGPSSELHAVSPPLQAWPTDGPSMGPPLHSRRCHRFFSFQRPRERPEPGRNPRPLPRLLKCLLIWVGGVHKVQCSHT